MLSLPAIHKGINVVLGTRELFQVLLSNSNKGDKYFDNF